MMKSNRLRYEPIQADHAEAMFSVLADPRIYTYLPGEPPESVDALQRRYAFLAGGQSPDGTERWLNWVLVLASTNAPIGFWQATVRPEQSSIAFVLNPAHWGQGLAHEASVALITHLFEAYAPPSLQAEIHFDNHRSAALIRRLGFEHIGKDYEENDDIYSLTRATWVGSARSS